MSELVKYRDALPLVPLSHYLGAKRCYHGETRHPTPALSNPVLAHHSAAPNPLCSSHCPDFTLPVHFKCCGLGISPLCKVYATRSGHCVWCHFRSSPWEVGVFLCIDEGRVEPAIPYYSSFGPRAFPMWLFVDLFLIFVELVCEPRFQPSLLRPSHSSPDQGLASS